MQRTTVKLAVDLDARLRHEAQRRGVTVSEITREAIERFLGGTPGPTARTMPPPSTCSSATRGP